MNITFKYLYTTIILLFASHSFAANNLDVSVDRTEIGLNETLNLRINANIKMDFSFGGLMNFGRNQVEGPDTSELEKDFEIIDQQQNYSMRSINGETTSQVTWSLALAPKQSGALTIPALKLKDAESKPINITVLENNAKPSIDNPPPAFLEVISDKPEAYVQEQIILTVRLYTQGRLSNASLTEPESTKAIIESFGEDKKTYRMAYNQRYDVIERQYLVFPQESGVLTIPSLTFNGMLIDSYSRRRLRVREQSDELELVIKAPNPAFTGDHWLPAISVHLEENWQEPNKQLEVGDSITREVKLTTLGLLGSAIPPFKHIDHDSFKSYPDKPIIESLQHQSGSQASRTESTTYIAIKPGTLEIPEKVITWWDTTNNVERQATLPARRLTVTGSSTQTTTTSGQLETAINEDSAGANPGDANLANDTIGSDLEKGQSSIAKDNNLGLFVLLLLTLAAWAATSYLLLKRLKEKDNLAQALMKQQKLSAPMDQIISTKDLLKAIDDEVPDLPKFYILWIKTIEQFKHVNSIADLKHINLQIYKELNSFEKSLYSKNETKNSFNKESLIQETKKLSLTNPSKEKGRSLTTLQAFYPR